MPKKKAVPDPTPELEVGLPPEAEPETVPADEVAETPAVSGAKAVEGLAAESPEEAVSGPDDPVAVPEDPPGHGQAASLEQEPGKDQDAETADGEMPEILSLEPGPSPDAANGTDGDPLMPEDLAGTPWPDSAGGPPADLPEWDQSPFPEPGRALDETAAPPDGAALSAEDPMAAGESAEAPASGEAEGGPEENPAGESPGDTRETEAPGVHEKEAEQDPASRRRTARRTRQAVSEPKAASEPQGAEAARPNSGQPSPSGGNDQRSFYDLDFNALDRGLSPEQRQEWNSIYASYRGRSVLTGAIAGVDRHSVRVRDRRTGTMVRQDMYCATVIPFRVRILIPSTEMWMQGEERPDYVLRNMSGAVIDFVVTHVDREAGFAIASRRLALRTRRYYFSTQPSMNRSGARVKCHVLAVGPRRCLVECGGYDIDLTQREMRYTAIPDLREQYHRGDTLDCIVKEYERESGKLVISVKETNPNPFDGAELRHPEGSRRQAEIAGKYAGGIFCNLPDGVVVMCSYSFHYDDTDFAIGDKVIVMIQRYDFGKKQIYGKIVAKW